MTIQAFEVMDRRAGAMGVQNVLDNLKENPHDFISQCKELSEILAKTVKYIEKAKDTFKNRFSEKELLRLNIDTGILKEASGVFDEVDRGDISNLLNDLLKAIMSQNVEAITEIIKNSKKPEIKEMVVKAFDRIEDVIREQFAH